MIVVAYKFTPEVLVNAFRHYRRERQLRRSKMLAWLFTLLFVPSFFVAAGAESWVVVLAIIVCIALLFASPYMADAYLRKNFRKSPYCDEDVVMRFDDNGLHEISDKSDLKLTWQAFTKVLHYSDGLLLFSGPNLFRWIPTSGFTHSTQVAQLEALLRDKVAHHQVVEHLRS